MERYSLGEKMELKELFAKHKDKTFIVVTPNKGNWGDELIRQGAKKLLRELNIKYEEWSRSGFEFDRGEDIIFYIHGVGGFGRTYPNVLSKAKAIRKHYPNNLIIYGPSTAMVGEEHLKQMKDEMITDDKFILFARERTTFNYLRHNFPDLNLYLDVCPSLHLMKEDLISKNISQDEIKILTAIMAREDTFEKPETEPSQFSIAGSMRFDPVDARDFAEFINYHLYSGIIYTNRCHSAILGMILNKPVYMSNNNYHKNKSVWEYCLKDRGVQWIGN